MPVDSLLSVRIESLNARHVMLRVFQHGASAGLLTVETIHAGAVVDRISGGAQRLVADPKSATLTIEKNVSPDEVPT